MIGQTNRQTNIDYNFIDIERLFQFLNFTFYSSKNIINKFRFMFKRMFMYCIGIVFMFIIFLKFRNMKISLKKHYERMNVRMNKWTNESREARLKVWSKKEFLNVSA